MVFLLSWMYFIFIFVNVFYKHGSERFKVVTTRNKFVEMTKIGALKCNVWMGATKLFTHRSETLKRNLK